MSGSPGGRAHTGGVRAVVLLTVAGVIALAVAVLTGSTPLAVIVVALAITGIVLLVREWREDRTPAAAGAPTGQESIVDEPAADGAHVLSPDDFSPDISTDPDGPSGDARAD